MREFLRHSNFYMIFFAIFMSLFVVVIWNPSRLWGKSLSRFVECGGWRACMTIQWDLAGVYRDL